MYISNTDTEKGRCNVPTTHLVSTYYNNSLDFFYQNHLKTTEVIFVVVSSMNHSDTPYKYTIASLLHLTLMRLNLSTSKNTTS